MTNPNHSHITIVADRTGSMETIQSDAQGAINHFLDEQKAQPGTCSLLLADFDSQTPFNVVHDGDLALAHPYKLEPRGMTPLYDAIGTGITRTGEILAALDEDDRPGHVFFVISTDGCENASREYTLEAVTAMIKEHEERWSWTFVFLASGLDAFAASRAFVGTHMVQNTVSSPGDGATYAMAAAYTASNVSRSRAGRKSVNWGADIDANGTVTAKAEPKNPERLP